MRNFHAAFLTVVLCVPATMLGCEKSATTVIPPLDDNTVYEKEEARFEAEAQAEAQSDGGV